VHSFWRGDRIGQPASQLGIRGHLLSHGVSGVQAASYDGHDDAPQKLQTLEKLYRFLTETSASVVHIASRVAA
jgi:hypothetical protein